MIVSGSLARAADEIPRQQMRIDNVELAYVDQGATRAENCGRGSRRLHWHQLEVVKLACRQTQLRMCCPGVRSWNDPSLKLTRFRRLSRDYERLATTLVGLHWLAFACLLLGNLFKINPQS